MAKIDLNTVSSGYLSQAALNANFAAIEDEFQNKVLYRDNPSGEPNSMQTHLDMNGYHILNAGNISLVDADNVSYTADGTGAETRTIAEKLNEVVSVKDFGAVGDGVTSDYTAFVNAMAASGGKTLRLPAGTYNLTFSSLTGFTPPANITIEGEGPDLTILNVTPPNSASYPKMLAVSAAYFTMRGVRINYLTPSGGTGVLFTTSSSNLRFENVVFDGTCTNSGASISHENHCISIPSSGTSNDVDFINCHFTRWRYALLKANASTCENRRWSFVHCDFYGGYNEDLGFNSPNGTWDDIQVLDCRFRDGAGAGASLNQLYVAFASCSNFRLSGCQFSGTVADAVHIEENCINWAVTGNTINVNGNGVFLVDNNIAGSYTMPQQGVISNNAISKSGTLKEFGKHGIWVADGGGASTVSLRRASIVGNTVVGFEFGLFFDSTLDDGCVVTSNVSENCAYGFRAPYANSCFKGNVSSNCTYGAFVSVGGSFQDHVFIDCSTAAATGTTRPVVLFNPTFQFAEFSVTGGTSVYKACVSLLANARAYGHMHVSQWNEIGADTSTESYEVTWDGATFTATLKVSYEPGVIACSAVRNSNNLAVQVFAASTRTTVRTEVKFNGMLSVVSS